MNIKSKNQLLNLQHYAGFCLVALLLTFILTSARLARTNFTGEYILTKDKSKIATGQMRMVFNTLKVTQNGNDLIISRTGEAPDGQVFTMDEKITLDGIESENKFFDDAVKKKSTAKWSTNEKVLTISSIITFNRDGNEVSIKSTEVWETEKAPGELSINYTSNSPNGEIKDLYVYKKK